MVVSLIVAMDEDQGIGKHNDLMWHLPDDMKFFKDTTKNEVVVMGRKNYDSIPDKYRPLPNRENAILSRSDRFAAAKGCKVFTSLKDCLIYYWKETDRKVFIIGGGEIYKLALDYNCVDEMYITHVHKKYDADTFFPDFELKRWNVEVIMEHEADEKHEAAFTVKKYVRK